MTYTVIIPARFGSSRLPGKPLKDLGGKSMVQRVYECARQSAASRVIVATDDQRIADVVASFGGEVCMTGSHHESGTDRLHEVVTRLDLPAEHIVVNVQGDEPLIPAAVIDQVADNLACRPAVSAATLCEKIHRLEDCFDPNIVKVVCDHAGLALYFSRAPIPWHRDGYSATPQLMPAGINPLRHIGIYAYRVSLLQQFVRWPLAPLEACEKLEQLRILANGEAIHVAEAVEAVPGGVDTELDLKRVRQYLAQQEAGGKGAL
ncbi:MAG TPA: 3-deoxy-manno-octulosonate cytidylyltransferase [Cellvibrionaceae bacterium]|nr:3-deoxy-manno-octulosonate cytidylyltransferase [Cellvibrionaceae bacterium]